MSRLRLATLWLDGCSGCHMSLLDTDEWLLVLTAQCDLVFSPFVDTRQFPEQVDIVCVEGAVSTDEDAALLRNVRQKSAVLIAMGDCAVHGNVPAMRNPQGARHMLRTVYLEREAMHPQIPQTDLPVLHEKALPLHRFVHVDFFIPGCPPSAQTLSTCLGRFLTGSVGLP
ncbi:MAG: NADP oxidoreductase [Desulfobulbus sp.]|nr:NADP oxidoreductase [Desulfobulbus sp.]